MRKKHGLDMWPTVGKGNCFFLSVVWHQNRFLCEPSDSAAEILREAVVDYIDQHFSEGGLGSGLFVHDLSLEDYVSTMKKAGEEADHLAVDFTARYLNVSIIVHDAGTNTTREHPDNEVYPVHPSRPCWHFAYVSVGGNLEDVRPNHYEPLAAYI